jgi:hypothetical protein
MRTVSDTAFMWASLCPEWLSLQAVRWHAADLALTELLVPTQVVRT